MNDETVELWFSLFLLAVAALIFALLAKGLS